MEDQHNEGGSKSYNTPNPSDDVTSTSGVKTTAKKGKPTPLRSNVWNHFSIFFEEGEKKGKCNYCGKVWSCDAKKHGTTNLKNHLSNCKQHPHSEQTRQSQLSLQPSTGDANVGILSNFKFDQECSRKKLAKMIILGELPFRFVEVEGFADFVASLNPKFKIPSRWTVARDCALIYKEEKKALKEFIKENCHSMSITTDTWTSVQNVSYMCVTAHFIDNNWRLHKKILSFCPIFSHKGETLKEWNINKVFCITVDNASANDKMVDTLRSKFAVLGKVMANGEFLHMRCIAHILNLVVKDGLADMSDAVKKNKKCS